MIEVAGWVRLVGVTAAVLLIPGVCLACRLLDRIEAWWASRAHRWRA